MENNAAQKVHESQRKGYSNRVFLLFFVLLMLLSISSIFWGKETILFFGFPSSFVFFFTLQIILSVGMAWFAKYHWKEEE